MFSVPVMPQGMGLSAPQYVCSKLHMTKCGWYRPLCGWKLDVPGVMGVVAVPQAVYVLALNALRLGCHPEYLWLLKEGQLSAQVPMERNVDGD